MPGGRGGLPNRNGYLVWLSTAPWVAKQTSDTVFPEMGGGVGGGDGWRLSLPRPALLPPWWFPPPEGQAGMGLYPDLLSFQGPR